MYNYICDFSIFRFKLHSLKVLFRNDIYPRNNDEKVHIVDINKEDIHE